MDDARCKQRWWRGQKFTAKMEVAWTKESSFEKWGSQQRSRATLVWGGSEGRASLSKVDNVNFCKRRGESHRVLGADICGQEEGS